MLSQAIAARAQKAATRGEARARVVALFMVRAKCSTRTLRWRRCKEFVADMGSSTLGAAIAATRLDRGISGAGLCEALANGFGRERGAEWLVGGTSTQAVADSRPGRSKVVAALGGGPVAMRAGVRGPWPTVE